MFYWIDSLARFIGYCALVGGVVWLLGEWAIDRSAARAAQADSDRLETMRVERPEAYEKEMWWRSNHERFKAGLPTDPGYIEGMQASVQSARENGLL